MCLSLPFQNTVNLKEARYFALHRNRITGSKSDCRKPQQCSHWEVCNTEKKAPGVCFPPTTAGLDKNMEQEHGLSNPNYWGNCFDIVAKVLDQRKACHKATAQLRQTFLPQIISSHLWLWEEKVTVKCGWTHWTIMQNERSELARMSTTAWIKTRKPPMFTTLQCPKAGFSQYNQLIAQPWPMQTQTAASPQHPARHLQGDPHAALTARAAQRLSKINALLHEMRYLSHKSPLSSPSTFPSL